MNCLVTGGAGFIGSNLVDELINQGHNVVVVDNLSTGKEENVNEKALLYKLDICDSVDKLSTLIRNYEIRTVFHLAALARVVRSVEDPLGTQKVNVGGTRNVMEACWWNDGIVQTVVHSSSSSIYGQQERAEMAENMCPNPISPYALQKLGAEAIVEHFARLSFGNINFFSLRYFNVYGQRQVMEGEYALVIGKFLQAKKEGKQMKIYGDGEQTRSYTHVSDVIRANIACMKVRKKLIDEHSRADHFKSFQINIGTTVETSVNQIAEMIGGSKIHVVPNPRGDLEERRKYANISRAQFYLQWNPKVSIEEGIKSLQS